MNIMFFRLKQFQHFVKTNIVPGRIYTIILKVDEYNEFNNINITYSYNNVFKCAAFVRLFFAVCGVCEALAAEAFWDTGGLINSLLWWRPTSSRFSGILWWIRLKKSQMKLKITGELCDFVYPCRIPLNYSKDWYRDALLCISRIAKH